MITVANILDPDPGAPTMGDPLTDLPLAYLNNETAVYFILAAMVAMIAGLLLDPVEVAPPWPAGQGWHHRRGCWRRVAGDGVVFDVTTVSIRSSSFSP